MYTKIFRYAKAKIILVFLCVSFVYFFLNLSINCHEQYYKIRSSMSKTVGYVDLPNDVVKRLLDIYKQEFDGQTRFGPTGYLLPARYKPHADLVLTMLVRHDDVWVMTFPRSGTHMTSEMIWLLQNNLNFKRASEELFTERNLFVELFAVHSHDAPKGYQILAGRPSPRTICTHLALSLLPPVLDTAKAVFVARDPRDIAVSYYYFHKDLKNRGRFDNFKQFWELFVEDLLVYTPYFPLVKEAWAKRNHPNMLFIFYEDIVKDMASAARRIAKFLGKEYSKEQFRQLCEHMDIDNMRNNTSVQPLHDKVFVNLGKPGRWRQYFDQELADQAERWMRQQLQDTDLVFPSLKPRLP